MSDTPLPNSDEGADTYDDIGNQNIGDADDPTNDLDDVTSEDDVMGDDDANLTGDEDAGDMSDMPEARLYSDRD